ncbi:MAG: polyamine aminopropyltransferase [Candidatus Thermoplasmatota archaeon]|jgi:spermidine synthase|nr:polyamine aminopropyltransferase [Candidatus Thermoplasmatota archaeon]
MKVDFWFSENQNEDVKFGVRVKSHLFSKESKYQKIDIFDTEFFGRVMILDGCFMITEKDEFMYQEMLSHPAMVSHPDPKDILIIGGGDGGVAREVLRYPVKTVDLVEIDEDVITAAKTYLPSIAASFADSRLKVYNMDAFEFVDSERSYDVILVDSTDPIGFAASLFSDVFYMKSKKILKKGGIIATQSGSPFMNPEFIKKAYRGLNGHFKTVKPYLSFVPSYPSGMWSYIMASDESIEKHRDFTGRYVNEGIYRSCFNLPEFVKKVLENQ